MKRQLCRLTILSAFVLLGLCTSCEIDIGTVNGLGSANRETPANDIYTVIYDGNENTWGEAPAPGNYEGGKTVTVPGPADLEKAGEEFIGWGAKRDEDPRVLLKEGGTFIITANIVLFAQWGEAASGPGGIVPEGEDGGGGIAPHENGGDN